MRKAKYAPLILAAAVLGWLIPGTASHAQQVGPPFFPQTAPANTVIGRTQAGNGPVSAIPFSTLGPLLGLSTTISVGSTPVAGGSSGQCLTISSGFVSSTGCGGVAGNPAGSNTQLQYNNSGSFGAITGATSTGSTVTFASSALLLSGASSGTTTLNASSTAGGTVTLPNNTGTVAELNLAQTWSAAQTFNSGDFKLAGATSGTTILNASGTASGTITLPAVTDTVAVLGTADQTLSGGANVTAASLSTGNVTIDCGKVPLQFITNGGAYTITAPSNDGSCMLLVTNNASAGATSFSGFTVGSNTGDALNTTNTNKFTISIWRINGVSGYRVAAHQ